MYTYTVYWSANGLRQRERIEAHNSGEAERLAMARFDFTWFDLYTVILVV